MHKLKLWATEPHDSEHFCWITGSPGAGKSTLACTLAKDLVEEKVLCAQYFVNHNDSHTTKSKQLFPSIALQLADFPSAAQAIYQSDLKSKLSLSSSEQAEPLLLNPIKALASHRQHHQSSMAVIIIDALDEFENSKGAEVAAILMKISLPSNVKIIVTSRPENDIMEAMRTAPIKHFNLDEDSGSHKDICHYISLHLKELAPKNWQQWPSKDQVQDLANHAGGLFHYASTSVRWIESQLKPNGRYRIDLTHERANKAIAEVSKLGMHELNELYAKILNGLNYAEDGNGLQYSQQIIECLLFSHQPLSIGHIRALLDISKDQFDLLCFFEQLRSILISEMGSVTEETIPKWHKSFFDYITSQKELKLGQIISYKANLTLTKGCLHILTKTTTSDGQVALTYACQSWPYHLDAAVGENSQLDVEVQSLVDLMRDWKEGHRYKEGLEEDTYVPPEYIYRLIRGGWHLLTRIGDGKKSEMALRCLDGSLRSVKVSE